MIKLNNVTTALKKFSGKPLAVTSKILGVATVASVIYDSHVNAKEKAIVSYENHSANKLYNNYRQYMVSNKESATVCKLKKAWFNSKQTYSVDRPFALAKGYLSGIGNTVIDNLPELTFSAIALCGKKFFCKTSGVLLALNGLKTLVFDVISAPYKKTDISK